MASRGADFAATPAPEAAKPAPRQLRNDGPFDEQPPAPYEPPDDDLPF